MSYSRKHCIVGLRGCNAALLGADRRLLRILWITMFLAGISQLPRASGWQGRLSGKRRLPCVARRLSLAVDALSFNQTAAEAEVSDAEERDLLHPDDFTMNYPKSLSPSSINEFIKCPQSFLFQYLYGIRQPTSLALAKGSVCHTALEQVFDLDIQHRTLEHLQNLFRKEWSQQRKSKQYAPLFQTDGAWDLEAETTWGQESLALLANYVRYEDPRSVVRPNPVQREVWVKAQLTLDPTKGSTGYEQASHDDDADTSEVATDETFLVRGIVDRLDLVKQADRSVVLTLTDYKTGKAPDLKYSPAMNEKIAAESFFQLQIYALLLREGQGGVSHSMDLRYLKLLYLTSVNGPAKAMEYDLGATQAERDVVLQGVHKKLADVWLEILQLVSQQDAKIWQGCDRSFCYCHKCRPRFAPGTVWEPPPV